MSEIDDRIYRAIRIWQKSRKDGTHQTFVDRLSNNVEKLLKEKKDLETENSTA